MKRRIFLSCVANEHLSDSERILKQKIIFRLKKNKYIIKEFYVSGASAGLGWNFENAEQIIGRCIGAVMLAFVRWTYSPNKKKAMHFTSEYLHYEGAIINKLKIPTLYLCDNRIPPRGAFSQCNDNVICYFDRNKLSNFISTDTFKIQFNNWTDRLLNKPDLFIGYSHKASPLADKIIIFLIRQYQLRIWDWKADFLQAHSILTGVIDAAERCNGAIFLFTKDDELKVSKRGIKSAALKDSASPSDNVTFETGYFVASKGKGRVLIIKEDGSKMPADLGGDIYLRLKDKNSIGSIKKKLVEFVERNF